MRARKMEKQDIETVRAWAVRTDSLLATQVLDRREGVVIEDDGQPLALGLLLRLDESASLESLLISPDISDPDLRSRSFEFLVESLSAVAKRNGAKTIYCHTSDTSTARRLAGSKFSVIASGVFQMVRGLA